MFRTLQSRLLLSHLLVIVAALCLVGLTLFFFATRPDVRNFPTLQRLVTISLNSGNELLRLREAGATSEELTRALNRTAVANNIRVVVADALTYQVLFDTDQSQSWVGISIQGVERPNRLLPNVAQDAIIGVFSPPNGSRWLVYSLPMIDARLGRVFIFYAQREPTPGSFFADFFLNPLLGAGVFAFLLSVLLAFAITRWVAHPLQRLAAAAEAIAQGEYQQQLPPAGPEEVQRVAASFNQMATQVSATQQAQRDFVANVSHDLKTPLTAIHGWSQALLDGTAVSAQEQQQAASVIFQETERMQRLVNQLLDLARIESGQLQLVYQPLDLAALLQTVQHHFMRRAQEQGVHLTQEMVPALLIDGDYDRLVQVFTNLLENAFTHTPAGGRVHLALKPHGDKAVEVLVQDTGIGIPPQELPRIFERFYQVDKSRAQGNGRFGTGLGLAIVRELVEAHHGVIQAVSQVGKGSLFVVRLPVSAQTERSTLVRQQT